MANFDDMKLAVEALSGGKNTVLFDDMGMPSVMFPAIFQRRHALFKGVFRSLPVIVVSVGDCPVFLAPKRHGLP